MRQQCGRCAQDYAAIGDVLVPVASIRAAGFIPSGEVEEIAVMLKAEREKSAKLAEMLEVLNFDWDHLAALMKARSA